MREKTEIKIFIASPGDTLAERNLIQKYIEEWNSTYGDDNKNIQLKIVRWEKDLAIRSNIKAQNAINEDLLSDCDILAGIFWTKFGSPTENSESGTLEEIEFFLTQKKPVLMYFLDKPIKPSEATKISYQLSKIDEFKKKYESNNIYRLTDLSSQDEFRTMVIKDLNRAINSLVIDKALFNNSPNQTQIKGGDEKHWYKESIKKLFETKLAEQDLPLAYRREISFDENLKLWRSSIDTRHAEILNKITNAREEAFNIKYGHYDYEKDLREKYLETWYKPITSILKREDFNLDKEFSVLGVASNNGLELIQIFKSYTKVSLSVLDLSKVAIQAGKKLNNSISFFPGNMEDCTIPNSSYDVYLNLRSIHSSGVDIRMTLTECYRILKPNGIAFISVSNGYLTPNSINPTELVETGGMYDNRIEAFSVNKPYDLINKIRVKLDDYGFKSIEVHTGKTEIFIKAKK